MTEALEACLKRMSPGVRAVLERSLAGVEISVEDGIALSEARGTELLGLCLVADEVRRRQVGDRVTYVVNRNINFTNVCIKSCKFCAFARTVRSEQGYFLPHAEVARRVHQAWEMGATEVCLQAGLYPNLTGHSYIDLCRVVKEVAPDIHIHAFSPEEVKFGASLRRVSYEEYLAELKEAGLGSLPGTSAEIIHNLFLALAYSQSITDHIAGFIRGSIRYVSEMYVNDENYFENDNGRTDDYTMLNAGIGLDMVFGKFNLLINGGVNNIADDVYIGFVNINSSNGQFYEAGEPRSFYGGINFGYAFN